jgi:hypothetical protein
LLLLVAMLVSASVTLCLHYKMTASTRDGARQVAAAKLAAGMESSVAPVAPDPTDRGERGEVPTD